mmetsp:Transcript_89822/g.254519  ORF Transcript_89822/g.254519 Transcript_89822/m.254519 type:complete len:590 (+) Transcript_89822:62-1831(+)
MTAGGQKQSTQAKKRAPQPKDAGEPAAKRSRQVTKSRAEATVEQLRMCEVVHQVGLVGSWYGSKEQRLGHVFERLPADGGAVCIFAKQASLGALAAVVERCRKQALESPPLPEPGCAPEESVAGTCRDRAAAASRHSALVPAPLVVGKLAKSGGLPPILISTHDARDASAALGAGGSCQYVINYDLPATSREYLQRVMLLERKVQQRPPIMYTLVDDSQVGCRSCQDIKRLLQRAKQAAESSTFLGGMAKAVEFDGSLEQLEPLEDEEEEEGDEDEDGSEDGDACTCSYCSGGMCGSVSYHSLSRSSAGVEVVRVPLHGLRDMSAVAPFIAPRHADHVCTLICLHCLYVHDSWDGYEHLFAPPHWTGKVRVVMVLADGGSWHKYPDQAVLCTGGTPWLDILDMESMDQTDALIERLVDHEAELLGGQSERIVMVGVSQGGAQSQLRFLRSRRRLGGWIGAACHAPTAPHTPRGYDPLLAPTRPLVNCDRPMRFLSGELDVTFPPALVQRDAKRLRNVGGFNDVEVELRQGLAHDGFAKNAVLEGAPSKETDPALRRAWKDHPEIFFIQKHLPSMMGSAPVSPASSPDSC